MTTATATPSRLRMQIGERVELARYTVSAGERILHGQRINGIVRITDRPAIGRGRAYLVERELEQDGHGAHAALQALLADYIGQARERDAIPMSRSVLRHELDQLR